MKLWDVLNTFLNQIQLCMFENTIKHMKTQKKKIIMLFHLKRQSLFWKPHKRTYPVRMALNINNNH